MASTSTFSPCNIIEIQSDHEDTPAVGMSVLEYIFLLGMTSLDKWSKVMDVLKLDPIILHDPHLTQIFYWLTLCYEQLGKHSLTFDTQDEVTSFLYKELSFDELIEILTSVLSEIENIDTPFSFNTVQSLMEQIRLVFSLPSDTTTVLQTAEKKRKTKFCLKSESKKPKPREFNSDSDETDNDELFAKLFTEKKKNHNMTLSQHVQYQTGGKRQKMSTPGEQGTHLIKIEISDVNDLKQCKNEKFYWQKVSKKGYFLLDVKHAQEKKLFDNIQNILVVMGEKLKKIKNVKIEEFTIDSERSK